MSSTSQRRGREPPLHDVIGISLQFLSDFFNVSIDQISDVIARKRYHVRIPLKSASDSGRNRPAIPEQSGRGNRSEATLEFFLIA
jgi:hypothetical protein